MSLHSAPENTDEGKCYETLHTFKLPLVILSLIKNVNRSDFNISKQMSPILVDLHLLVILNRLLRNLWIQREHWRKCWFLMLYSKAKKDASFQKRMLETIQLLYFLLYLFPKICVFFAMLFLPDTYKMQEYKILGICRTWWRTSAYGGGSKSAATSRMELVLAIVINGWHPWTIFRKWSILDVAAVLDSPMHL